MTTRAILLLLSLSLIPACAHHERVPEPTWVTARPQAAVVDGKRWFVGVGSVESQKSTGPAEAEASARQAVLKTLDDFISRVLWWNDGGNPDAQEPADITRIRKVLQRIAEQSVARTQIADRWTSRDATTLFVLSRLDADMLFHEIQNARDFSERDKEALKSRGEDAFERMRHESDRSEPRP